MLLSANERAPAYDGGAYLVAAAYIATLDDSGAALASVLAEMEGGLWARYVHSFKESKPVIVHALRLHAGPSRAPERNIYGLLDSARDEVTKQIVVDAHGRIVTFIRVESTDMRDVRDIGGDEKIWHHRRCQTKRTNSVMAYDAQRKQTVLFSGNNGRSDTWGWDGSNWTQLADSGPAGRAFSAMAYDAQRKQTVLFSGDNGTADTWGWNGTVWTQLADTGPTARSSHSMAYDSSRDRTVLFGGLGVGGDTLGDTWEWNGSTWTQLTEFGAPPCFRAALAFKGDSVALFGGTNGFTATSSDFGTTWTWDGKHWTLRQDFGPQPRFGHKMVYDTKRGTLVLFGGSVIGNFLVDTWEHSEGL